MWPVALQALAKWRATGSQLPPATYCRGNIFRYAMDQQIKRLYEHMDEISIMHPSDRNAARSDIGRLRLI
jgi:hypothetical protein